MKRMAIVIAVMAGVALGARPGEGAKKVREWYQKSDQPLKIFNWKGPGADKDDCAKKLLTRDNTKRGDSLEAPDEPKLTDLGKIRNADIVYIRGHGGCLQTNENGDILKGWNRRNTFLIGRPAAGKTDSEVEDGKPYRNINFTTDPDRGPSLAIMWGCHNGRERFGTGMGVPCDSKTKAFVAPKWNVQGQQDSALFQCKFFEEFSKGDVSVKDAARAAYDHLVKNSFSPTAYEGFDQNMFICGNGDLTLDDIRENVEKRNKPKPSSSPSPPGKPGKPGKSPSYVATSSHNCGRYCTNCPKIQSTMPLSPVVSKTKAKRSR